MVIKFVFFIFIFEIYVSWTCKITVYIKAKHLSVYTYGVYCKYFLVWFLSFNIVYGLFFMHLIYKVRMNSIDFSFVISSLTRTISKKWLYNQTLTKVSCLYAWVMLQISDIRREEKGAWNRKIFLCKIKKTNTMQTTLG